MAEQRIFSWACSNLGSGRASLFPVVRLRVVTPWVIDFSENDPKSLQATYEGVLIQIVAVPVVLAANPVRSAQFACFSMQCVGMHAFKQKLFVLVVLILHCQQFSCCRIHCSSIRVLFVCLGWAVVAMLKILSRASSLSNENGHTGD